MNQTKTFNSDNFAYRGCYDCTDEIIADLTRHGRLRGTHAGIDYAISKTATDRLAGQRRTDLSRHAKSMKYDSVVAEKQRQRRRFAA